MYQKLNFEFFAKYNKYSTRLVSPLIHGNKYYIIFDLPNEMFI